MPRGFLVKRSRRPTPVSYRARSCAADAAAQPPRCSCCSGCRPGPAPAPAPAGGEARLGPLLLLPPPPLSPPPPPPPPGPAPVPLFGTPDGPPAAAASGSALHSPARAVSEERVLPLGSPASAESFPAPDPLLLAPGGGGGELPLWAAALAPAAPAPPPRSPASKRPSSGRKGKAARRLHFEDEVTTSPVLGLRIREGSPDPPPPPAGHPPPQASQPQQPASQQPGPGLGGAAAASSSAPLGEFVCQLCKERYPDPLGLAQHKCSRIVRVEYRCPECDKLFSCPANLASHRRWHKPRPAPAAAPAKAAAPAPAKEEPPAKGAGSGSEERDTPSPGGGGGGEAAPGPEELACPRCAKRFRRQSALRKHLPVHQQHQQPQQQQPPEAPAEAEEAGAPSGLGLAGEGHPCPVCGEPFPSKSGQERHLRLLHAAQAFPCKYCPATFYSSPGLTRHINKCHPSENRQVILLQVPVRPAC